MRLRKKIFVLIFPSFHPEASLISLYKCTGWQAVCTHSVSLESQEVQAMQAVPFPREICGSGFAGHLQVDFWVIPVPTENATHSPWCLPDRPGPGRGHGTQGQQPSWGNAKASGMVKTSCGAQQTAGSSFLGSQVTEYWNEFKRIIYQPFTKLSALGAVKLWFFLLLLGSSSLGRMGFGNLKGKWNRFLK